MLAPAPTPLPARMAAISRVISAASAQLTSYPVSGEINQLSSGAAFLFSAIFCQIACVISHIYPNRLKTSHQVQVCFQE